MKRKEILYLIRNQAELEYHALKTLESPKVISLVFNWNFLPFGIISMSHYLVVEEGIYVSSA